MWSGLQEEVDCWPVDEMEITFVVPHIADNAPYITDDIPYITDIPPYIADSGCP